MRIALAVAILAALVHVSAAAAAEPVPVPSLEPAATEALWKELVSRTRLGRTSAADTAGCRPLRATFYAPTDWMRLATKLAANASPCADYAITIPPLAS